MFRALDESGKKVGRAFVVWRADGWIEILPKMILPMRRKPGWDAVWEAWLDSMSVAAKIGCLLERQRKIAAKVSASRSALVTWLYCRVISRIARR